MVHASHTAIIKLSKFYGVSTEYLLGLSENREEHLSEISDLRLDDETVRILKSGTVNNIDSKLYSKSMLLQ